MRSKRKFVLVIALVLGVVAVSAGIAIAAVGDGQERPASVSPAKASVSGTTAASLGTQAASKAAATQSQAPASDDENEPSEADDVETGPSDDAEGPGDDESNETDDDVSGQDDADQNLTGETGTKASDAALASAGGGTVLATESDDGGAGYEVETRNADGSETEVELDKSFNVVQRAGDEEATEKTTVPDVTDRDFDTRNFSNNSTTVDNQWLPLRPGTQLVFTGNTIEDGDKTAHRVIFTVTDLVKTIDGVRSVVLWDRDYSDGELVESEIAFFAQDDDGNVWQTGEYPQEYEGGKIIASPIWIHGEKGARAGLTMKADPRLGTTDYALGWGPAIGFNDRARVFRLDTRNCVPVACFTNVLVTEEFNPDEPGSQLKYYARSIGNTRVGWSGKDEKTKETLVLVEINSLDAKAMAEARSEARKLEQSAYQRRPVEYGKTPPLTRG